MTRALTTSLCSLSRCTHLSPLSSLLSSLLSSSSPLLSSTLLSQGVVADSVKREEGGGDAKPNVTGAGSDAGTVSTAAGAAGAGAAAGAGGAGGGSGGAPPVKMEVRDCNQT